MQHLPSEIRRQVNYSERVDIFTDRLDIQQYNLHDLRQVAEAAMKKWGISNLDDIKFGVDSVGYYFEDGQELYVSASREENDQEYNARLNKLQARRIKDAERREQRQKRLDAKQLTAKEKKEMATLQRLKRKYEKG